MIYINTCIFGHYTITCEQNKFTYIPTFIEFSVILLEIFAHNVSMIHVMY